MADNGKLLERVTARPDVFGGKPIVRDMRITVEHILSLLSQGLPKRNSWTTTLGWSRTTFVPASPTPIR